MTCTYMQNNMQNNMLNNSAGCIFCIFCILQYAEYAKYAKKYAKICNSICSKALLARSTFEFKLYRVV